jgi:hypothetical protein
VSARAESSRLRKSTEGADRDFGGAKPHRPPKANAVLRPLRRFAADVALDAAHQKFAGWDEHIRLAIARRSAMGGRIRNLGEPTRIDRAEREFRYDHARDDATANRH